MSTRHDMDYMDLTDEELLSVIKQARTVTAKKGTDFAIAIKVAMQVYLEEKMNKESMKEESELPIVEKQPNFENITADQLKAYYLKNNNDIAEKLRQTRVYMEGVEPEKIEFYAGLAAKGLLSSQMMELAVNKSREPLREELRDYISKANELTRENFYVHYMYELEKAIDIERKEAVNMYLELKSIGIQNFVNNDKNNLWADRDASPTDFEMENYDRWLNNDTRGVSANYDRYFVEFDPTSFDQDYAFILKRLNSTAKTITKESFNEARRMINEKIERLQNMTVQEYRQYKLAQMHLTPEEKALFEQHLNEYIMENEKSSGHNK